MIDTAEGWGFPGTARKAHYFVGQESLCRNWGFYRGPVEPDERPSKDDCAACRRKLETRKSA